MFSVGVAVGSFIHVLVYRTVETDEDWKTGRSRCDHCHTLVEWYDNIPLLSYILLRGRCRSCHKRISPSHLFVELLTGILFVWWYFAFAVFFQLVDQPFAVLQPLFWLLVGLLSVVIVVADLKYFLIPDWAVAALGVITLLYRIVLVWHGVMRMEDFVATIIASLAAAFIFWLLWYGSRGRALGFGDVKLVLVLGLLVGWPKLLFALFAAFVSGAVVGIVLLLLGKRTRKQAVPFGPFLILGSFVALVWGGPVVGWYLRLLGL